MADLLAEHVDPPLDGAHPANRRYVVRLDDGATVEAVLYRDDTLCVSSQVGCAVGCPFCASGAGGVGRSLDAAELDAQVALVTARGHAIRRVTVSGVGEPLHAHAAVWSFAERSRARGVGVSVTTSGGPVARLAQWLGGPHNGLTISVHAGTEPTRARLVPRGPALGPLFDTLGAGLGAISARRRKKVALAYLALDGDNDGDAEVDAFAARAAPLGLAVHLYAHNPVPTSPMRAVPRARYERIFALLRAAGLVVRMASRARVRSNGGCGTLVALRRSAPDRRV